jgi:hypothetical protein
VRAPPCRNLGGVLGEIGTLAWTRRTNGLLSRTERLRYVAQAARAQAGAAAPLLAFRLGRGARRQAAIDEDGLRIPDSRLAQEAIEECVAAQPPFIVEHNYRSFIFARALASLNGIGHDEELLFVATMFHDAGVFEPDLTAGGRCFTLKGAADAESHLAAAGSPAARCAAAAEAITLHINPSVPLERGPEAHLMHDGVLLDAVGLRAWDIRKDALQRVRSRHPRLRFSQDGRRLLAAQGRAIPGCRIAAAMSAGFGLALRVGPWQD